MRSRKKRIKNLGIDILKTPIHKSETNDQIERCHSTIRELVRCIKSDNQELSINVLVKIASHKYSNTMHSLI